MLTRTRVFAVRKAFLAAIAILSVFGTAACRAEARQRKRDESRKPYVMVGQLSEREIIAIWPPARRQTRVVFENRSGRRFYRANNTAMVELGDWIPDEALPQAGRRLAELEERMRLRSNTRDRDADGIPDREDHHPWDPRRQ